MGKRRLTERQIAKTRSIQAERIKRVQNTAQDTINQSSAAEQPGLLIAHYGITVFVENQAGGLFRCDIRQNLGSLATGDEVVWQQFDESTGVVTACRPRQSVLMRATRNGPKPLAANLSQLCVIIAPEPKPQKTTIDRYLVLAQNANIDVLIVLNKIDLIDDAHPQHQLMELLNHYRKIGYRCIALSSKTHKGLTEFESLLHQQRSILVGQSGVGKSSLLMALVPGAEARVQALSHLARTGKHTTTTSRLFHLPRGGDLVDTPGANQLLIYHLSEQEIAEGFKEFSPFLGRCKYRDCKHVQESGCALQAAIHEGEIQKFRLHNFFKLLSERKLRLSRNSKS